MKYKITLLIIVVLCESFISIVDLEKNILGEWEYQYSLINNLPTRLETEKYCPVNKMVFKNCNDQKELKKMPKVVRKLRQKNIFRNISCETYNNRARIDKYFPIASQLNVKSEKLYNIVNYGCQYKSEYYIEMLINDTLIIFDDKNYIIETKNYTAVRHIYMRKK